MSDTMFPEISGVGDAAFRHGQQHDAFDVWIDRRLHFEQIKSQGESALAAMGIVMPIDEIAIMVYSTDQEYALIEAAVRNGFTVFNAAFDSVDTFPIESHYEVHYTFLRHEESGYRLEVMRVEQGISPLHLTLAGLAQVGPNSGLPVVVHASFKVKDIAQLGEVEQVLEDNEWALAQSCSSTYGRFSYWLARPSAADSLEVYLKPRANLRDAR